jgi:hypothetical protein
MNNTRFFIFIAFLAVGIHYLLFGGQSSSVDFSVPPSWPLLIVRVGLSNGFRYLSDCLLYPPVVVINDLFGMWRTQIIYACTRLEISDILIEGPKTLDELASAAKVANSTNLLRLLRAAESLGYYKEDLPSRKWSNTVTSLMLSSSHKNTLKDFIGTIVEDGWAMWGQLYESIKDDPSKSQYDIIHGQSLWQKFEKDPELEARFARAMSNADSITWYAHVHDFDWGQFRRVVDIGGSLGAFSAHVLDAYPNVTSLVFDQPQVIEKTVEFWNIESNNVSHLLPRMEFARGSFFDVNAFPALQDNDVVVMKCILHDWSDDISANILSNLRQVIGTKKVTLAVIDVSLTPHDIIPHKYLMDLHMHVFAKGKERYVDEWKELFQRSGFLYQSTTMTRSTSSVTVALPV